MGPWPPREDSPYADLDDNAVIDKAREIYRQLQRVPRWHAENDRLLRAWGAICGEMGRRGITDTVTEGSSADDMFGKLMAEQ